MENEMLLPESSGVEMIADRRIKSKRNSDVFSLTEMAGCTEMTSVLAQSVCEIQTPITVGVFGKWGSGKSRIMQSIADKMADITNSAPKIKVGLINLLWRLIFFVPLLNYKCKKQKEVKYIFVSMTALDYVGTDKLWAGIITKISKQLDKTFGSGNVKFFRAFHSRKYSLDAYNSDRKIHCTGSQKWKANPVTAYLLPLLSVILIALTVTLIIIYGFPVISGADTSIGSIFSSVFVGALGVGAVSQIGNVAKVSINLIRTQSAKVTKMAKRPDFTSSLGFMSTVRTEIRYMTALTTYMGHLIDTDIRICLTIDDVDRLNKQLIMNLFQVVSLLDTTPNSPFVQFLCMDPLVVANIVKKALSYELASNINGHEYIKRIIRLPFNIPTLTNSAKRMVLSEVIDEQIKHNFNHGKSGNGSVSKSNDHKIINSSKKSKVGVMNAYDGVLESVKSDNSSPKKIEHEKIEENTMRFLKNSEEYINCIDDNLRTINRIVQSVEVSIRLYLRQNQGIITPKDGNRLSAWVILADQWPYRLSWLWQYVEDNRQQHSFEPSYPRLPSSAYLEDIYRIIASDLNKAADWENLITLDWDPELFKRFLQIYRFKVEDLEKYLPYTINLNYSLKRIAARAMAKTNISENSAKLCKLRRDVTEQKALVKWTIDDFCQELSEMGLEEINVARYQKIAKQNNLTGSVLTQVSMKDLKNAFEMTIGDWTLFTSHIKAYRSFYGETEAGIPLINTTGSPPLFKSISVVETENTNNSNNESIEEIHLSGDEFGTTKLADTVV